MDPHDTAPDSTALAPKQEAAALALAQGQTFEAAAKECGAGLRTVKEWSASQPAFRQRITSLRQEMTDRALGVLTVGMVTATATLLEIARKGKSEHARVSAARAVLELSMGLRMHIDFEARLRAMEDMRQ